MEQVWKLLRLCVEPASLERWIRELHNISRGQQEGNVTKQARQMAYCIRQAEEYFRASSEVSLATRGNLLYYGMVSLSQAVVLLKQDGKYSIDALRSAKKHRHHGLEFTPTLTAGADSGRPLRPTDRRQHRCAAHRSTGASSCQECQWSDGTHPGT